MGALDEPFRARVEAGEAEQLRGHAFVALCTLESGARYGLCARLREELGPLSWARVHDGELTLLLPGTERHFVELLENGRDALDEAIAQGARALALDADEAIASLPAPELVGAILETRSPHYCRLGLGFLRPTELRGLRDAIAALAADGAMPQHVRELAQRLVVPA